MSNETSDQGVGSTQETLFNMGFTKIGDSRDFTNGSVQVVMARGMERITWTFPFKVAKLGIITPETGSSYIQMPVEHLSFDVVSPIKK